MAKIISADSGMERDVKEGGQIKKACKEMGVSFGCEEGNCGICGIEVVEGEDNLSEMTPEEENFGKDKKHRLACQCRIEKGEVKIRNEET